MLRQIIWAWQGVTLYQYKSVNRAHTTCPPLLIIFSTINKPDILDLTENLSFIKKLLINYLDIYLLDWGDHAHLQPSVTIDDYIDHYLLTAINVVKKKSNQAKINLLGICQGGLWSLCYASLYQDINKLILISVPVDFQTEDHVIAKILGHINIKNIHTTNIPIPGSMLTQFFLSLQPFAMIKRCETSIKNRMLTQWLLDSPDQAHNVFKKLLIDFYQKNNLIKNKIKINKKIVYLKNISIPILNIMASKDNIVQKSTSIILEKRVGSKMVTNIIIEGGHISIYLKNEQETTLPTTIATFIHSHIEEGDPYANERSGRLHRSGLPSI